MLALAKYTLKGPYHASAVVGVLAIVAVFFPLVSGASLLGTLVAMVLTYMSATLVGLIILTQGIQSGLKAIVVSILGITLVATIVLKAPELGISIGLVQWLPIVVLAQTFRTTNSLAMTLIAGVALGFIAIVAQQLIWPDLEENWQAVIRQSMNQVPQNEQYDSADLSEQIRVMMHWLILALVASLYVVYVTIVLVARRTQARLAGSDGFQREFTGLALGKPASMAALVLVALSLWLEQDWIISLAILVSSAFLFQGIAVVHAKIANRRLRPMLTGLFYALLLIFPQIVAVTMVKIINFVLFISFSLDFGH